MAKTILTYYFTEKEVKAVTDLLDSGSAFTEIYYVTKGKTKSYRQWSRSLDILSRFFNEIKFSARKEK